MHLIIDKESTCRKGRNHNGKDDALNIANLYLNLNKNINESYLNLNENINESYLNLNKNINESYDKIDGKYVKNNAKYFHYTSIEAFHKIANSFLKGEGLAGKYYPANTNTYGELSPKNKRLPNEVCLARSGRIPDNNKAVMSGNIGDIKLTFKEEALVRKFGKIKPIDEYSVQDKKWIKKSIQVCKDDLSINAPLAFEILDVIDKRFHSLSQEQMEKYVKKLALFSKHGEKYPKELLDNYKEYHNGRDSEHMESRVRVPEGKFITLDLIKQIMIPDYLKGAKEINGDIMKLREKGFNNIVFYKCKYPKDNDYRDSARKMP